MSELIALGIAVNLDESTAGPDLMPVAEDRIHKAIHHRELDELLTVNQNRDNR